MAFRNTPALTGSLFLALGLTAVPASAHISLESGGIRSRYGDGELKEAPCGRANGRRGTNVYTYAPGQTITITFRETIPHPSYFRIAFDNDGDNDFKEPQSIKPIDPFRPCPYNSADKCGASDFYNTPAVLMDNLEPHLSAQSKGTYTFQVKLPDVECTNCTLQVIQVMEDTIHGAYNPVPGSPGDTLYVADNYHQCIDLVLTRGAGTGGSPGTGGSGTGGRPGTGGRGGTGSGGGGPGCTGCMTIGSNGVAGSLGAVALGLGFSVAALRRRRRQ